MTMILELNGLRLLLGSKSPRRQALLAQMDLDFDTVQIDAEESFDSQIPVNEVAEYLAQKKSIAYKKSLNGAILITSDTTVILENDILNKPQDIDEARNMLLRLSGKSHIVNTGVCLRSETIKRSFYEETEVILKKLTIQEIDYYIQTYKPFDKAGAYGIQEWIGMIGIQEIKGCYYNVMGLPTSRLYKELCKF
jgi:septum formation protein